MCCCHLLWHTVDVWKHWIEFQRKVRWLWFIIFCLRPVLSPLFDQAPLAQYHVTVRQATRGLLLAAKAKDSLQSQESCRRTHPLCKLLNVLVVTNCWNSFVLKHNTRVSGEPRKIKFRGLNCLVSSSRHCELARSSKSYEGLLPTLLQFSNGFNLPHLSPYLHRYSLRLSDKCFFHWNTGSSIKNILMYFQWKWYAGSKFNTLTLSVVLI